MNLYLIKTSRGEVYYIGASTMERALQTLTVKNILVLSCEVIATSAKLGDIANYNLPELVITQ